MSHYREALATKKRPQVTLMHADSLLQQARDVLQTEARGIADLADRLDGTFADTLEYMHACRGRVVVTGVGKSGLVGQKLSATLASTGTPSWFVHASEAAHGDLGRITPDDVVLALSNSGESEELVRLAPAIRQIGAVFIVMTAGPASRLAAQADVVLSIGQAVEACPMGMVPTTSAIVMMALGDALAMSLFASRGLDEGAYARVHPGGHLAQRLTRVREVMRAGERNPVASVDAAVRDVLAVMTDTPGRPGAVSLVDSLGVLVGFFTDGDLRRGFEDPGFAVDDPVVSVMNSEPKSVAADAPLAQAKLYLRTHQVDQLAVVDEKGRPVGLLDVQDLLGNALF